MGWLLIASILILGHVVLTDFKGRYVHIWTMILVLALTVTRIALNNTWYLWEFYLMNVAFTLLLLVVSILVVSWRKGLRWSQVMGAGDYLFLLFICFWMDTMPFVIFFNISLITALFAHILLSKMTWYQAEKGVPFAGYFAFTLVIYLFIQ